MKQFVDMPLLFSKIFDKTSINKSMRCKFKGKGPLIKVTRGPFNNERKSKSTLSLLALTIVGHWLKVTK